MGIEQEIQMNARARFQIVPVVDPAGKVRNLPCGGGVQHSMLVRGAQISPGEHEYTIAPGATGWRLLRDLFHAQEGPSGPGWSAYQAQLRMGSFPKPCLPVGVEGGEGLSMVQWHKRTIDRWHENLKAFGREVNPLSRVAQVEEPTVEQLAEAALAYNTARREEMPRLIRDMRTAWAQCDAAWADAHSDIAKRVAVVLGE